MNRSILLLAILLAAHGPLRGEELVSAPQAGESETAQAGGGTGRFSFVGALRCDEGLAMVGVRLKQGPLLEGLQLACAPITCATGQCRWRADAVRWGASAGTMVGEPTVLLCPNVAMVVGFRAIVVPVQAGSAVQSFAVQCAPLAGLARSGGFGVGPITDPRSARAWVPPIRAREDSVTGRCVDRGATAFSVAVGAYPRGAGGQGAHIRALSMFCPGATG